MSTKTVAQKLFLKERYTFAILNEPENFRDLLGDLPVNAVEKKKLCKGMDVIQYFVIRKANLLNDLPKLISNLKKDGYLWIAYPKGTSEVNTDLNRDLIINIVSENNLKAVSLISIDDIWTSLRCRKI